MSGNNFGDSGVDGSVQLSVKVLIVFVRLRIGTGSSRPTGLLRDHSRLSKEFVRLSD
jgi:hypothetical protein